MTAGLEGRQLGRYHLVDRLGAGRHGTVYRAYDPYIDRPVAVKVAHRGQGGGRMFVEAQMAASLHHPNITSVYDAGSDDGLDYIVTELVPHHRTAGALREAGQGVPSHHALHIVRQCAEAVAHAHARGILHRDIKPSNVLVAPSGQVHLTDFGLALPGADAAVGRVGGSPAYLAPEVVGGRGYSEGSDLYALGVMLFELLTGTLPFDASSLEAYRAAQAADSGPTLAGHLAQPLPAALQRVIERCLAAQPQRRYRSVADLIGDLMVVQECLEETLDPRCDTRAELLGTVLTDLEPKAAQQLSRLGDWRRLASGQALPPMAADGHCLIGILRGQLSLTLRPVADDDTAPKVRRIAEGGWMLLPANEVSSLVAGSDAEVVLLDEPRLERLPESLQRQLLRLAALCGWQAMS
jgi:eukaryotic-like serine/threonine-protein kinase